jgi:hypothetical protein
MRSPACGMRLGSRPLPDPPPHCRGGKRKKKRRVLDLRSAARDEGTGSKVSLQWEKPAILVAACRFPVGRKPH